MRVVLAASGASHSYYDELVASPPEGIAYDLRPLSWRAPVHGRPAADAWYWKRRGLARLVHGPPLAARVPDWGAPVHAMEPLDSPRPWVLDYEHPNAFFGFDGARLHRPGLQRRLARLLAPARLLLPWTQAAADACTRLLPETRARQRVVLPAAAPRPPAHVEDEDAPCVLFVAKRYRRKGGAEALEAFARARREVAPRARMVMVSDAPDEARRRYEGEGVTFVKPDLPRARLLDTHYPTASVFLMPTHYDTFGMVFLEAFAHGLPVVTTDTFAADELVRDGEDGFVVEGYRPRWFRDDGLPDPDTWRWERLRDRFDDAQRERVVSDLADRLARLLGDASLRRRMMARAHENVREGGRFSVGERNARLRAAYREAFGT